MDASHVAVWGALLVALIQTLLVVRAANAHGAYVGDDLISFWFARTLPLATFLRTPIDVHFVPLHRLVNVIVYRLAPLQFTVGLGVLVMLHAVTVVALYRVVAGFAARSVSAVLTCVYAVHPCLLPLLVWWTSGLHRLGCVCFVVLTLASYGRYRAGGKTRWLLLFGLANVCALALYAKGVLIPLYLILLELNLVFVCRLVFRKKVFSLALMVSGGAIALWLASWHWAVESVNQSANVDVAFLLEFAFHGLRFFFPTVAGGDLQPYDVTFDFVIWISAVVITTLASPRALVSWLSLLAALAANFLCIALSAAKTRTFGLAGLLTDRYYFEVVFLVALFGAMALETARLRLARWFASRFARAAAVALVLFGLVLLSGGAWTTTQRMRSLGYADADAAAGYMRNLRADLSALSPEDRRPLVLLDSRVPVELMRFGNYVDETSELLVLMAEEVKVRSRGAYRVANDGHLEYLRRRRR